MARSKPKKAQFFVETCNLGAQKFNFHCKKSVFFAHRKERHEILFYFEDSKAIISIW